MVASRFDDDPYVSLVRSWLTVHCKSGQASDVDPAIFTPAARFVRDPIIVAADHWDWIWPLQYSFDRWLRATPDGLGPVLRHVELGLSRSRGLSRADASGGDVVSAAIEAGKVLHLAEALSGVEPGLETRHYPSSVSGIAAALFSWDERVRDAIGPAPKPKRPSQEKAKRRRSPEKAKKRKRK